MKGRVAPSIDLADKTQLAMYSAPTSSESDSG